ncbi:MAG: hypothetical protein KF830_11165 [Planctomycetes bacterium]|nr:hypothetical protein [Planctomycetota bacterium]
MLQHLEITEPQGGVRRVAIGPGTTTFGSAAEADVPCRAPGIAPRHLRFVRTERGVRVEPCTAGGVVEVNGEALFCKDLEPGDEIVLGAVTLRWLAEPPVPMPAPPPARRPPPRGRGRAAGHRPAAATARRPRTRRGHGWWLVPGVVLAVLVAGALMLRTLADSTWPRTPQYYVDLAREQLANGQPQRALDTLEFALRDAEGATRAQAQALQADIRRLLVESAEAPRLQAARQEHDLLAAFEARYLGAGAARPAAREFVRQCDDWLGRHGDLCRRLADGAALLRFVEQRRAQHLGMAALGEPDGAADVVFAAQSRLRFQWRDYRGAIGRLDAFLAANADAVVQAERARLLAEGEVWLQGKLRLVDQLLARGDRDNAARDLQQLERWSALPEWAPLLQERRARLAAGEGDRGR